MKDLTTTDYAPVVLFVYNRPLETQKTIDALKKNHLSSETELFIYSDGPNTNKNYKQIEEVRNIIHNTKGFKKISIIEQTTNQGLAKSIIEGVTTVIGHKNRAIILEDDIITSPNFLRFMNSCLTEFKDNKKIMHVSGYSDPVKNVNLPPIFFWRIVSTWGWATWKDRWDMLIENPQVLQNKLIETNKINDFDLDSYGYFLNQLSKNISGKKSTWGIKWQASIHLNNGLCVNPGKTLVKNIGFGNSASNTKYINKSILNQQLDNDFLPDPSSVVVQETIQIIPAFRKYYRARTINNPFLGTYVTIKNFLKHKLYNIFH